MKKQVIKRLLCAAMVMGILTSAMFGSGRMVQAASDQSTSYQNVDNDNSSDESELKENSWRYENGEPIKNNKAARAAQFPDAWKKVDGQYVNDKGEVIPGAQKKGIDVSVHNGTIDWEKVKADGIEFAIIRCGYGSDMASQDDKQWKRNVSECERLGIPYGVYLYSYAYTLDKAKSEAQHVLRLLEGHNPTYPVYYDLEDEKFTEPLSASMKGQVAKIFCDTVAAAGYDVGIYSSLNWWNNVLTDPVFDNPNWSRWVAQWNSACTYKGSYDMWQCTDSGKVAGIGDGKTDVDLNFFMGNLPGAGKLQYDSATGKWNVYKNGKIDTGYTGMAENEYGWWYVTNGTLDWSYTGMAENIYGWWYLTNGAVDWNYEGMAQNPYGWWYIKNGTVDWNYEGMAENIYGWWYIKNGTVDWNFSGMAENIYGWWYLTNGTVDWNYVGMAQNPYSWWYIKNGTVDWNYEGMAQNEYGWWYITNGTVDWNFNGVINFEGTDYTVVNGYAGQ